MNLRSYQRHHPHLGQGVYIDPSAQVIGSVDLADDVSVWPNAIIRGDGHRITVGARSNIQDGAMISVSFDRDYTLGGFSVSIGQDVTIGPGAILHACSIADGSLIGMRAIVMDGSLVKRHAVVAAGALVTSGKVVGEGEMWMGSPAYCVRRLTDDEIQQIFYSAQRHVHLKNRYLAESFYEARDVRDWGTAEIKHATASG